MAEPRSAEPTEEQVSSLCEIAGFTRTEAISRLKANGLDADRAVDEWLNNPDSSKYRWDESAWSADREGDANTAGIGFHVQGPDVMASYHNSAAPTRPPSRTNNRSPLGAPATAAEADADLQRAMAMSRAEAGLPPQETGIIDNDVTVKSFGPATRAEYENDQWAMVPIKADAAQTATELPSSARKRTASAPAFLRTNKDHRLGAIITILHAIPKARNMLLSCGPASRTYGHNSEWWNGQPILSTEALEMLARDEWATTAKPDFYEELHRLMAFLDNTERAYGTIDNLAQTDVIDPAYSWSGPDFEDQFFSFLKGKYDEDARLDTKLFISTAKTARVTLEDTPQDGARGIDGAVVDGSGAEVTDVDMADSDSSSDNCQEFPFMDINLDAGQNTLVKSLYDALDGVFWNQALTEGMENLILDDGCRFAYLTDVSEILTIRINGEGLCQPCDIPGVLYMDRYMESRKDAAMFIQDTIHRMRSVLSKGPNRHLSNLNRAENSIQRCDGEPRCRELGWWDGKPHLALDCWHKFIKECEAAIKKQRKRAQKRHTIERINRGDVPTLHDIAIIRLGRSPYELTDQEKTWKANIESDVRKARKAMNVIDDILDHIDASRQRAHMVLDTASKFLTCREEEAPSPEFVARYIHPTKPKYYKPHFWDPTHRYHLRGVATTKEITYVCTRREPVLIELEGESEPRDQWWRLVYAPQETTPLSIEKTDLDTVTMLAGTESKNPILVYAAEEALDTTPTQVSDALRMFVRADNRSFQNELAREQAEAEQQAANQTAHDETATVTTLGDGPVPLTADAIQLIASDELNTSSKRKYSIAASSVATIDSADSRDLEMSFSDVPDRLSDRGGARSYHREFASPAPRSTSLSGLVCESGESPIPGHLHPGSGDGQEVHLRSVGGTIPKAPEMQERATTGPSPFVAQRPVEKASQAGPIDLMDIDVEHVEDRGI